MLNIMALVRKFGSTKITFDCKQYANKVLASLSEQITTASKCCYISRYP